MIHVVLLHKHDIAKESQKHGNAKKPAVNYEPAEVSKLELVLQYSMSHKQAPWSSTRSAS